jgi:murein DD-endopeptidase MepM/ murein hydrolase activator NlpD
MDRLLLDFPFRGRWMARNSPARRVPSHGTALFGTSYAIDFVAVDSEGRSAPASWRSAFGTETPDGFVGFGAPILAPVSGIVVAIHNGEPDHVARRSLPSQIPYALRQPRRIRAGLPAIAGNHVAITLGDAGPIVLLAHLRRDSVSVAPGQRVSAGDPIGQCGNSGNSVEPHVHVQAVDALDWGSATAVPIAFRRSGLDGSASSLPQEGEVVDV